jgi:hypothetical protein
MVRAVIRKELRGNRRRNTTAGHSITSAPDHLVAARNTSAVLKIEVCGVARLGDRPFVAPGAVVVGLELILTTTNGAVNRARALTPERPASQRIVRDNAE